jgi:hypothetical protein
MGMPVELWWQRREAALNWLAFGLLLAAWNAADDAGPAARRPPSLRGYNQVSVRAVERSGAATLQPDPGTLIRRTRSRRS